MTELELNLPELNPAQQRWLQGYIAEQQRQTLQELNMAIIGYKTKDQVQDILSDRIATLKKESRG